MLLDINVEPYGVLHYTDWAHQGNFHLRGIVNFATGGSVAEFQEVVGISKLLAIIWFQNNGSQNKKK